MGSLTRLKNIKYVRVNGRYFWIIIFIFFFSCANKEWKSALKQNVLLYNVKLTRNYNLRADTLADIEILKVKNVWLTPEYQMALFEVNPYGLFFTPMAYKSRVATKQYKQCPFNYNSLSYILVMYKNKRDLNYIFRKMKTNTNFLVFVGQHVYKNDNIYDSLVGVYTYKYFDADSKYLDSLILCK